MRRVNVQNFFPENNLSGSIDKFKSAVVNRNIELQDDIIALPVRNDPVVCAD
jgi:hypothetical protein